MLKTVRMLSIVMLAATAFVASAAAKRPNVLFILTDDQRWDALGIAGNPHLKTPHMDRLGHEGVYFKNTFCTTSLCSPSRASILSGVYAHTHGVQNNFTEYPANFRSFPMQLQSAGYDTAYFGKWHMGENNDQPRPGFNWFVTHKGQGKYFDTEWNVNGQGSKLIPGYYTHIVTLADKPLWLQDRISTWHGIYGPLFEWRKVFPDNRPEAVKDFANMTRAYWGTIRSVDDSVGRFYDLLKARGELDNTVIVHMGDNGLLNGEHGMVDKRTMHEASIRIPLLVRFPGLTPPTQPKVIEQQVLTVDMAPSLLELCGAAPLKDIHGKSWVKLVQRGDPAWRKSWLYHYNYEKQFPYTPNVRGVRTEQWKYIHYPHGDGSPDRHMAELYNMEFDTDERHNLIANPKYAGVLKELQAELTKQLKLTGLTPATDKMPMDEGIKKELPDQKIR
ncbi:MAG: sulfatase-like hydrolase/transferase [Verrucomicrobia bacterium]|nr:sulfatase-like hydrolase/transferase [Verrucomicrobiota bacterium]